MSTRLAVVVEVTRPIRLSILFLLIPIAALAQSGVWGTRGISQRFLVDGNYVLAVDGQGFSVYDAGTPGVVKRLSRIETSAESIDGSIADHDLMVSTRAAIERFSIRSDGSILQTMHLSATDVGTIAWNGHLLAASTPTGIRIWHITAGGTVADAGVYPPNGIVESMAWKGDALFVAFTDIGIKVIDGNTALGIGYIPEPSRGFAISGNILYSASGGDGVGLFDVSNPASPAEVGRTLAGVLNLQSIAVAGTHVFAAEPPNRIHVIDASSIPAPHEVATLIEPAQVMAASGDRLFVSGPNFGIYGDITDAGSPLRVFDVANLATPQLSADVSDGVSSALAGVATNGSLAYVSDPPFFRVLDVSTTQSPREIASLRIDGLQPHVRSLGTQAILYGTGDVQLVDTTDPYHPRLVKTFHSLGRSPSNAAFVANGVIEGNTFTGFHLVDFFNYPQAAIVAGVKIHPFDLVANGGPYAYVSLGATLLVFNFPAPNTIVNTAVVGTGSVGMAYASATTHHPDALILHAGNAVSVLSLADPANPADVSDIPFATPGPLAAAGDSAWIGTVGTLTRMDITNLVAPFIEATSMQVIAPQQIAAANGKVVVADRYSIRVFGPDTAAPPPPGRRPAVAHH